jgi:hypothetical protein
MNRIDELNSRERFRRILNFEPVDRMPMIEWAPTWNLTADRWVSEGLDISGKLYAEIQQSMGLDLLSQIYMPIKVPETFPVPASHGAPVITCAEDYDRLRSSLYPKDLVDRIRPLCDYYKSRHDSGEMISWITFEGFFWFPRTIFGIENHFYAFYDEPELMHRMNQDLTNFILEQLDGICELHTPDFMTFAEDMSYNHGPMLSKDLFDEFILPYYRQLIPKFHEKGIKVIIDSDGDVTEMIPWLIEAGCDGLLPLERQAGVDVLALKKAFPDFLFIGAYDKMVMKHGEEAMRAEFERLLPAMEMGGFIASVDHQTPPDVSLENYRIFIRLLREYSEKIGGIRFKG